ncbi:hypothetical protein VTK73DRAFT_2857 [Phialemonium thermophilum]|uniref:Dystroglycan-type cadherin-like domain-containing protein n=1 Tax=Phialemonium thermophilum TaxID=223376 RepID=A0ABR3X266_9PEZI
MAPLLVACLILCGCRLSLTIPTVTFPLNSQVPPVARLGQPFSFVFSSSTFASAEPITYSLRNGPDWLSIDSDARRIFGTPREGDVGPGDVVGVPVDLVATDNSGSASLTATLVISRNPSPSAEIPLSEQIPDFGTFSQPSSILAKPGTPFTFSFGKDTFSDPSGMALTYYAVTSDNTPLPAWMSFDPATTTFSGTTPPIDPSIGTPQSYGFLFVASDVVGFAAASIPFSIVVGNHEITADSPIISLKATVGAHLSYTELRTHIRFDGQDPRVGDVSISSTAGLPSWLSVDPSTWEISGTPPADATSANFSIVFQDSFSDSLNVTVSVDVTDGIFKKSFPQLNITGGNHFEFDLNPYLSDPSDTDISVHPTPPASWVKYDAGRKTIYGDAPKALSLSSLSIAVSATLKASSVKASAILKVRVQAADPDSTTASKSHTATSTETGEPTSTPPSGKKKHHINYVLLAILLPIFLLLAVVAVMLFCFLRRRRERRTSSGRRDISGPVPGSLVKDVRDPATDPFQDGQFDIQNSSALGEKRGTRDAFGGFKKTQSYVGVYPAVLTPPDSVSLSRSSSGGVTTRKNKTWLQIATGKLLRRQSNRSFLSDTDFHDGPEGVFSRGALSPPGDDSTMILHADIPTPDFTSIQTTPDVAYTPQRDYLSGGHQLRRTTTFEDFLTTIGSSPSVTTPTLPSWQDRPTPPQRTKSWAGGGISRLMKSLRRKNDPGADVPERDLNQVLRKLELSPSADVSAAPAPLRLSRQPVTRPDLRETPIRRHSLSEGSSPRASPPGMALRLTTDELGSLASPPKTHGRRQDSRDSLGISHEDAAVTSSRGLGTKETSDETWSTIYSLTEDGEDRLPRGEASEAGGSSRRGQIPDRLPPIRTGLLGSKGRENINVSRLSFSSSMSSTVASLPNWSVLQESPAPAAAADGKGKGGLKEADESDVSWRPAPLRTRNSQQSQSLEASVRVVRTSLPYAMDTASSKQERRTTAASVVSRNTSSKSRSRYAGLPAYEGEEVPVRAETTEPRSSLESGTRSKTGGRSTGSEEEDDYRVYI